MTTFGGDNDTNEVTQLEEKTQRRGEYTTRGSDRGRKCNIRQGREEGPWVITKGDVIGSNNRTRRRNKR